ncbi:MAG TPA: TerB family tellurite resistance protein [Bryobacteraceae bacterium]|nr:TerB family tellurite resistance protein [Bryobacteraceae bacterium]
MPELPVAFFSERTGEAHAGIGFAVALAGGGKRELETIVSILRFFGLTSSTQQDSSQADAIRKIARALDQIDQERARYIAAFAYILSRVAHADMNVSPEETAQMERLVMEKSGLPEDQAVMVVQIARHQNLLFGATEDFLVTREFREIASREERLALLDCLFAVAAAEHHISLAEENEIRRISDQLLLEHRDYIAVKSRYRDHLAVLKPASKRATRSPSG